MWCLKLLVYILRTLHDAETGIESKKNDLKIAYYDESTQEKSQGVITADMSEFTCI